MAQKTKKLVDNDTAVKARIVFFVGLFGVVGLLALGIGRASGTLPEIEYKQSSPTQEYNAPKIAGVKDGLSGMFISRKNPGVHWFIVDHLGKLDGNWQVFAIDSVNEKLVWRGKFAIGSSSSKIPCWCDVEDLSAYRKNGEWYITVWDNGANSRKGMVYEFKEPDISLNQSRKDQNPITLQKKIKVKGLESNIEGMAYSDPENAMYFLGPRGSKSDFHDNKKYLRKVSNWDSRSNGSEVSSSLAGRLVARPINADVPNAVGGLDISADGDAMLVVGVASSGDKINNWAMPFVKKNSETWDDSLDRKAQLTKSEAFEMARTQENGAFTPNMDKIFTGGESGANNTTGKIFSVKIDYTPSDGSGGTTPPEDPPDDPDPPEEPMGNKTSRIEAEDYRNGGEGVGYHDTTAGNRGSGDCRNDDVDLGSFSNGGCAITWISDDEWLKYRVNISKTGNYTVLARVANGGSTTEFVLRLDGSRFATFNIPNTGGWGKYKEFKLMDISLPAGNYTMKMETDDGSFNLDRYEFIGPGSVTSTR